MPGVLSSTALRMLVSLSVLGCVGCVSLQQLREEAEQVFREHNRVAGEVMLMFPDLEPGTPATQALVQADAAMLAACEPLNAVAVARRDQRSVTLRQRLRLPPTVEQCRDATTAVQELLEEIDRHPDNSL